MEEEEGKDKDQFEALIQGLIDHRYASCDDFFSPTIVLGLADNIEKLSEAGDMIPAGLGNKSDYQLNTAVRGDRISWIDNNSKDFFEKSYNQKVQKFITHLNSTCFTSIKSYESHYAAYTPYSVYKRHIDTFKSDRGRKFSIVVYLNDSWQDTDAGLLSLYPTDAAPVNLAPMGGRLVFFRSDEMEHEVHPSTTRERRSIAGWLKD